MKIAHSSDWRRFSSFALSGLNTAKLLLAGLDLASALTQSLPGTGNAPSGQTIFKVKTQAREMARRRRQHYRAGHRESPLGPIALNKLARTCTRCESWQPPHPHAAKPAPGTAQPLARGFLDREIFIVYYSDGTYALEEDVLDFGYKGAERYKKSSHWTVLDDVV